MFDVNGPNNVNLSRMIYSYLLKTHNSQVCEKKVYFSQKILFFQVQKCCKKCFFAIFEMAKKCVLGGCTIT